MRAHKIKFIQDDVLKSELPDAQADFIISTFGLKTFNAAQHEKLAKLIAQKLRPGGVFSLIEASDPKGWMFRPFYIFHLKFFLPVIEKIFLRGATDFKMIGTYSTNFGDASALGDMMRAEGLEVEYKRYFFGCATGLSGRKPSNVGPSLASDACFDGRFPCRQSLCDGLAVCACADNHFNGAARNWRGGRQA